MSCAWGVSVMEETIQHLKQKVANLEAEIKRLNKLIDNRYKSRAKPIAIPTSIIRLNEPTLPWKP